MLLLFLLFILFLFPILFPIGMLVFIFCSWSMFISLFVILVVMVHYSFHSCLVFFFCLLLLESMLLFSSWLDATMHL